MSTRSPKKNTWSPGYAIIPPADSTVNGETVYGSYTVVNRWPQKTSEQRTLYLNQFTGQTITNATAAQDGALSRLTSFGIAMHMGNQLGGVLTRITATLACLAVLTSVLTGLLMWWKRRPSGRTGVPGPASPPATRAATPKKAVLTVSVAAVLLGVLFPVFGVSVLVVLAVEAVLVLRRRSTSGGAPSSAPPEDAPDETGGDIPVARWAADPPGGRGGVTNSRDCHCHRGLFVVPRTSF